MENFYCSLCMLSFPNVAELKNHNSRFHFHELCHDCVPSHHIWYECPGAILNYQKRVLETPHFTPSKRAKLEVATNKRSASIVFDGEVAGSSKRIRQNIPTSGNLITLSPEYVKEVVEATEIFKKHLENERNLREAKSHKCERCNLQFLKGSKELAQHYLAVHPEIFEQNNQHGSGEVQVESKIKFIPHPVIPNCLSVTKQFITKPKNFSCNINMGLREFWRLMNGSMVKKLKAQLNIFRNYKVHCSAIFGFERTRDNGTSDRITCDHTSVASSVLHTNMVTRASHLMFLSCDSKIDRFTQQGSGWNLEYINDFRITLTQYKVMKGGDFMEIPDELKVYEKKTFLNIENGKDQKCFLWSVLAGLKPHNKGNRNRSKQMHKPSTYNTPAYKNLVNIDGLNFPISESDIRKFEKINPDISLTIIGLDVPESDKKKKTKEPLRNSNQKYKIAQEYLSRNAFLFHNTGVERRNHVDLLMMMNDRFNPHFVLIEKLGSLYRHPSSNDTPEICRNCLQCIFTKDLLHKHQAFCKLTGPVRTTYPKIGTQVKFEAWRRTQLMPFVIYADFESFLVKYDPNNPQEMERKSVKDDFKVKKTKCSDPKPNPNLKKINFHKPCGYALICVDHDGKIFDRKVRRAETDDEDIGLAFIADLCDMKVKVEAEIKRYQEEAKLTLDTVTVEDIFESMERNNHMCCFCEGEFEFPQKTYNKDDPQDKWILDRTPVRHHSHLPPYNYIGQAHRKCNLEARISSNLPVFIHNFSSYDCHFLIPALGDAREQDLIESVSAIPRSSEKFLSVMVTTKKDKEAEKKRNDSNIIFLDSLGFTLKGLGSLVKTLKEYPDAAFNITKEEFKIEKEKGADLDLLFQKGAYPYTLMKSCKDFQRARLPDIKDFYDDLREEAMEEKIYQHAEAVWKSFNIQNMGEWHDLYVRLDTSLLADVIQNIRGILYGKYSLDIAHYFSLPMVAWDGVLKFSKVELDLITDPTMHVWIESAIRGGYTSISAYRQMEANNKYMSGFNKYDPNKQSTYILYIDANNLYGQAMSSSLPVGRYSWVPEPEIVEINKSPHESLAQWLKQFNEDSSSGCFVEVDLTIPEDKHDYFNEYPPAPSKQTITNDQISFYQQELAEELEISDATFKTQKLIADLNDKKNYVVHYKILETYMKLGVQVMKVHKAVTFDQKKWMKPFIDENTKMRTKATSDFQKDFWKLLNNAAYGKTIEQVRNRERINFVTSREEALRFNRKPTVKRVIPIKENLSLFVMKQISVYLNKPIAIGAAILDIAKNTMYCGHKIMKDVYQNNAKLLYTDTDSFVYGILADDVYQDMISKPELRELFDMSKYDPSNPIFGRFHNNENKAVLGKFKDEFTNAIITNFVAARPKLYAIEKVVYKEKKGHPGVWDWELGNYKKAKGVPRVCVEKQLDFNHYQDAVEKNIQKNVTAKAIRSKHHFVTTEEFHKKALNCFDTKRYFIDKDFSYAFGHKDIALYA